MICEMATEFIAWARSCKPEDLGLFGEVFWAKLFTDCGLGYFPLCRLNGQGAPMQEGEQRLIAPDFDLSSNRFSFYVDSKAKRHAVFYRCANESRHGINRRNFAHYQTIAERNRKHCCLAVLEFFADEANAEWSGALLIQTLAGLRDPFRGYSTGDGMVYWPRIRFRELGHLSALSLAETRRKLPINFAQFREPLWDILECENKRPVQMNLFS